MSAADHLLDRQAEAVADKQQTPGKLIRLIDVPRGVGWLPRRRGGTRLNVAALHRWADDSRPVHLRTTRVGGTRCTTEEWLREFFDRMAARETTPTPAVTHTPARRQREVAAAERELAAAGIA